MPRVEFLATRGISSCRTKDHKNHWTFEDPESPLSEPIFNHSVIGMKVIPQISQHEIPQASWLAQIPGCA
jgi:hypothetical protein